MTNEERDIQRKLRVLQHADNIVNVCSLRRRKNATVKDRPRDAGAQILRCQRQGVRLTVVRLPCPWHTGSKAEYP